MHSLHDRPGTGLARIPRASLQALRGTRGRYLVHGTQVAEGTHDGRRLVVFEFLEGSHSDPLDLPLAMQMTRWASDLGGFTDRPSQTTTSEALPLF